MILRQWLKLRKFKERSFFFFFPFFLSQSTSVKREYHNQRKESRDQGREAKLVSSETDDEEEEEEEEDEEEDEGFVSTTPYSDSDTVETLSTSSVQSKKVKWPKVENIAEKPVFVPDPRLMETDEGLVVSSCVCYDLVHFISLLTSKTFQSIENS